VELERQKEGEREGADDGDPQQPEGTRVRGQIVPLELDPTREDSLRACLDAVRAKLPAGEDGEILDSSSPSDTIHSADMIAPFFRQTAFLDRQIARMAVEKRQINPEESLSSSSTKAADSDVRLRFSFDENGKFRCVCLNEVSRNRCSSNIFNNDIFT